MKENGKWLTIFKQNWLKSLFRLNLISLQRFSSTSVGLRPSYTRWGIVWEQSGHRSLSTVRNWLSEDKKWNFRRPRSRGFVQVNPKESSDLLVWFGSLSRSRLSERSQPSEHPTPTTLRSSLVRLSTPEEVRDEEESLEETLKITEIVPFFMCLELYVPW